MRVGDRDRDQEQESIQPEEKEAQAIDTEVIADSKRGDPRARFLELQVQVAHALLEATDDRKHQGQREHRGEDAELLDDAGGDRGGQRHEQRAGHWDDQHQRQPGDTRGQRVPVHAPTFQGR